MIQDPKFTAILFAILVKRLGGEVTITQTDVDEIAYNFLQEHQMKDGSLVYQLAERGASA